MNIDSNFTTSLSGQYMVKIKHSDGSITETHWMKNLILNSGMDDLGNLTGGAVMSKCHVGTGTSTPVATQIALDSRLNATSTLINATRVQDGAPNYTVHWTTGYTFPQGAVVGNITEVGVSELAAGSRLFSRALFVDANGSPISISVVALDQLTIYYKLSISPPITDSVGTIMISGTPYGYTGRVAYIAGFCGRLPLGSDFCSVSAPGGYHNVYGNPTTLGAITANPTTSVPTAANSSTTTGNYVVGSFSKTAQIVFASNTANLDGGIVGFMLSYGEGSGGYYQYKLDSPIPKTNTNELRINVTTSWARA